MFGFGVFWLMGSFMNALSVFICTFLSCNSISCDFFRQLAGRIGLGASKWGWAQTLQCSNWRKEASNWRTAKVRLQIRAVRVYGADGRQGIQANLFGRGRPPLVRATYYDLEAASLVLCNRRNTSDIGPKSRSKKKKQKKLTRFH